ncbi:E3 ubiquitin-protein ligase Mdm2 [Galendromus occidentalis]|uniref:E3 ubiquitin-protein ligase Mdm2 n=1 Tax=Galendromus occidentalis TaxID=34638 RepID=A0AAJ6QW52_9ACAR|nr:E3 ubiquitin-protein ligase Mdm2 [Galendromus occidentalis]
MLALRCSMTDTVSRASQAPSLLPKQVPSSSKLDDFVNMYILDKAFYRILEAYGMPNEPVTFWMILFYLRKHILSKGLFDPSRPDVIKCSGDPLGTLFKRISFTNREAVDLIKRHISPVFTQKLHDVGGNSPNGSNSEVDVLHGVTEAMNCLSDQSSEVDLEIEFSGSDDNDDSSSTTNLSIFEEFHEKSLIKSFVRTESEDEISIASFHSCETEYNEFEPYSEVGSNDDLHSYSSDSDLEIHIVEENIMVESIGYTEGDDFFADSSDCDSSITANKPECPVTNPWFCKCVSDEAKTRNGFCHNCWTAQFGWRKEEDRRIPPSIARRKRKCTKDNEENSPRKVLKVESPEPCDRQTASSPLTEGELSFSQGQLSVDSSSEPSALDLLGSCVMCESRPKNTAIVHGRSAHIVGCYKCSRKIQEKNLKCPQCRRVVERVVRLFL